MLNDKNVFRMYDFNVSLDVCFKEFMIRAADQQAEKYNKKWSLPFSSGSKLVGFEFGSQCVLGWQKITCYFLTQDGQVYHLTPCIPLKFGIETSFFDKLSEKGITSSRAINFITLINTRKRVIPDDQATSIVTLTEDELDSFTPELQGPILNTKLDSSYNDFIGITRLNVYPQSFITYNMSGEFFVQLTFAEPEAMFEGDEVPSKHVWVTKD